MYTVTERYSENIAKSVRFTEIVGELRLKTGDILTISDKDILENSLSISSKLNSKGEFRAGGIYASELSVSLLGIGSDMKNLDRAVFVPSFRLYTDSGFSDYDEVPLGAYNVDGSTIRRRDKAVSFKALDRMVQFDRAAQAISGTLFELVTAACTACGVAFGMTEEQFSALPNSSLTASVDTSIVQSWRDLLMYVGTLTNSFARISRTGALEFVQLTCEKDEDGHIIPVREVMGTVRFSTEYSDSYQQITKMIMRRGGEVISSSLEFTGDNSENFITTEWTENPLLADLSDEDVVEILNNAVRGIYNCHNLAYKADISGDPALDVGDYVRLCKGDDNSGSYVTGMITVQNWKYGGNHSISCALPASVSVEEGEEISASVQPKTQEQKQIDAIGKKMGSVNAIKLLGDNGFTLKLEYGSLLILAPNGQVLGSLGPFYGQDYIQLRTPNHFFVADPSQLQYNFSSGFMARLTGSESGLVIDATTSGGGSQQIRVEDGSSAAFPVAGVYVNCGDGTGLRRLKFADE